LDPTQHYELVVRYIAQNLVAHPEDVTVVSRDAGRQYVIELHVAADDVGKVIGKGGRVANAIRTVLNAVQLPDEGKRIILEID
jgi:uncharacterized protein